MKRYKFLLTTFFFFVTSASAQVMPSSFIYEFNPEAPPVINVEVSNFYTDRTVRVEAESIKVINPSTKEESHSKELGLLVSPRAFSLSGGEKRVVRLLLKEKPTDKEEVYRVNFVPKSYNDEGEKKEKKGINLAVLMGAGILVFAPPPKAFSEIHWEKSKGSYILKNTGKKNLEIGVEAVCNKKGEECKVSKAGKRLYEGQTLEVNEGPVLKLSREVVTGAPQKLTIDTDEGSYRFPD